MPTKDEMAKFAKEIDNLVSKTDYNYIEAIVEYCKQTGLEIEVACLRAYVFAILLCIYLEDAINLH